jgi:hypothetical protein
MHQKTSSIHRDFGDFRMVFLYKVISEYAKLILASMEIPQKHIRRIRQEFLPYMENTLVDLEFLAYLEEFRSQINFRDMIEWAK